MSADAIRTWDPPLPRKTLIEETLVVLSLSILGRSISSILSLFEQPIAGVAVVSVSQTPNVARQFLGIALGLAPVWLVTYLVRRSGEGVGSIGLDADRPGEDSLRGVLLFAFIGVGGILVYLGAVALDVNRFVIPVPPLGYWWTYPVLIGRAFEAGLLEEVVVCAYLVTRLRQIGFGEAGAITTSAGVRASYHLYQGWGGFAGNLAMGVIFAFVFSRTRRAWPLVIAHTLLDIGAGIGFILFREHLPGF